LRVARERFGISYFTTRRDSVDIMAKVIDAIRA
jgi:hypothetical protein